MNKRFFLMSLLLLLACSNGEEENPDNDCLLQRCLAVVMSRVFCVPVNHAVLIFLRTMPRIRGSAMSGGISLEIWKHRPADALVTR